MQSGFLKLITLFIILLSNKLLALDDLKNNKLTLQLQWKHQFQFAGYYIAKEKGFYKESGLDVLIKEHHFGIDVVKEVLEENVQFATGRPSLVINKANGDDLILLSAIFQSSPNVLLALKKSNIKSIEDFKNKRVMITGNAKNDLTFLGMMHSQQVKTDELTIQKHSYNLKDLVDKKTDLMASYISNEPFRLKEMYNLESTIFDPKDYGFDFYGDILFTKGEIAKNNPLLVKKFKEASIKGWEYAFENIEETADIILKKYNTQNKTKKALVYEGVQLKKLAYYKTNKIGKIDEKKIEKIFDAYNLIGLIKGNLNFSNFIFSFDASVDFNPIELNFLKNIKQINMCIDPNWMPYEKLDKNGNLQGLSKEYFDIFQKNLDNKIEIVESKSWTQTLDFMKENKCDFISLMIKTDEREKYMNFSKPYMNIPLVLVTKLNTPFIDNIKRIRNKKIGIIKSHGHIVDLRKNYPNLNIIEVEDIDDGLEKVQKEEIFAFIGSVAEVSHIIQTKYLAELKIGAKLDDKLLLRLAVNKNKPILQSILEKVVFNIPKEKTDDILEKHLYVQYETKIDYSLLWKTLCIFTIIIILILIWVKTIKKQKEKVEQLVLKLEQAKEHLKESNKEFKRLSETDSLTQIYNRVKIDDILEKEYLRTQRYQHKFSVIIIDIDDFKKINDTFGHQIGDTVLVEFVNTLKSHIRNVDTLGRWGGEEFFIICPETNLDGACSLAENLRANIENYKFDKVKTVTASFGVASFTKEDTIEKLIQRADKALYDAKDRGKNRVSCL